MLAPVATEDSAPAQTLSTREFARALGIGRKAARRLVETGQVRALRYRGESGREYVRIPLGELERLQASLRG